MTSAILVSVLFAVSLLILLVGLVLGFGLLLRPAQRSTHTEAMLSERFAQGEISSDEYRERLEILRASSSSDRPRAVGLALTLVAIGLVGSVASGSWATSSSWGWMTNMMAGDMGSMMSMMQSGPTERVGDGPKPGATTTSVVSREFSFSPAEVSLRAGDTVNIEFRNEGDMFHTLTIPELDLDLRAQSGDSVTGAITPDDPGTYEFICTVPQHAEMGMRGRVVVTG